MVVACQPVCLPQTAQPSWHLGTFTQVTSTPATPIPLWLGPLAHLKAHPDLSLPSLPQTSSQHIHNFHYNLFPEAPDVSPTPTSPQNLQIWFQLGCPETPPTQGSQHAVPHPPRISSLETVFEVPHPPPHALSITPSAGSNSDTSLAYTANPMQWSFWAVPRGPVAEGGSPDHAPPELPGPTFSALAWETHGPVSGKYPAGHWIFMPTAQQ